MRSSGLLGSSPAFVLLSLHARDKGWAQWDPPHTLCDFRQSLVLNPPVHTMQTNYTIDDTKLGDNWMEANVTYSDGWTAEPNECASCLLKPIPSLVFDETWHYARKNLSDVGAPLSFNITFPGTAIYVYGIAFKKTVFERSEFAETNLSFTLDGRPNTAPNFYAYPLSSGYQNNTLVYHQTGLKNDTHTLEVSLVNGLDSPRFNAFLFDYAVYTVPTPAALGPVQTTSDASAAPSSTQAIPDPAHKTLAAGPIAGIVLGVLALMSLVVGILIFFLRRRRARKEPSSGAVADLSPSGEYKPDSQGYFPETFPSASLNQTSSDGSGTGVSKQQEASALRAELQRLEARNAEYFMPDTTVPPAYDVARR